MSTEFIAKIGKNFIDSTRGNQTTEEVLILAKRMVFCAKQSGATVVKFQTHVVEDEIKKRKGIRFDWISLNEKLTPTNFWFEIATYCDGLGIEFLTTPMSKLAAQKIDVFVKRWKVSSADIVDFELLEFLRSTGKPVIISTGMSTPEQIEKCVEFLGNQIQYINYCVSIYPCPIYVIDFRKMLALKEKSHIARKPLDVGFSDHSLSVEVPALAVRMGAVAIEKHFTLDRNAFGPDHKASLLPEEFKKMVELCKLAETEGESFEEEKVYCETYRKKI